MAKSTKGKNISSCESCGIPGVKTSFSVGQLKASISNSVSRGSKSKAAGKEEEGSWSSNNLRTIRNVIITINKFEIEARFMKMLQC